MDLNYHNFVVNFGIFCALFYENYINIYREIFIYSIHMERNYCEIASCFRSKAIFFLFLKITNIFFCCETYFFVNEK